MEGYLVVLAGAGLGGLTRYVAGTWIMAKYGGRFPLGTHQHKKTFFHVSRDLPIMVTVIDTAEKITAAAEAIEGMVEDGLIVISDADVVRLVRSRPKTEVPDATGATR